MSILDDITAASGTFPMAGATTFQRLRAGLRKDDYNPNITHRDDWDHPETITFKGALSQSSSTRMPYDGLNIQTSTYCYITMPADTDVQIGDRITPGPGLTGTGYWTVDGFPSTDVNAFTGWKPTKEARCKDVRG